MGLFSKTYHIRSNFTKDVLRHRVRQGLKSSLNQQSETHSFKLSYDQKEVPFTFTAFPFGGQSVIEVDSDYESAVIKVTAQFNPNDIRDYKRIAIAVVVWFLLVAIIAFSSAGTNTKKEIVLLVFALSLIALIFTPAPLLLYVRLRLDQEETFQLIQTAILKISEGELTQSTLKKNEDVVTKKITES